ncbi:hypothetical protein UFOVP1645_20 [uncultured Caudovirales phage]|uniref:Uncharacterized protein n=1 Tax=uncultured Caudovirales phage TaxID=2100421 RepID=A0A6J5T3L4_9CAUD|nr:hypothetical protein UFOVP1645_20 [uncultured Caudovirales phage]
MPVSVRGVIDLRKALSAYAPDLAKELTKEIGASLRVIQKDARGFVPSSPPGNLYGWDEANRSRKITSRNSSFRTFNTEGRVRLFPLYNPQTIKAGIVTRTGYSKPNARGFRSLFRIKNNSAVGAIYETAGRKNPNGQPWVGKGPGSNSYSHSTNPDAGRNFTQRQGKLYGVKKANEDMRGRLIYRAWEKDQGKQTVAIFKAIDATTAKFKARTELVDLRRAV